MSAPGISAEAVKAALAGLRQATLWELCAALDIPDADWRGRNLVRKTLQKLRKSGQVGVLPGAPLYSLTGRAVRRQAQQKLWRAICLKSRKAEAWGFMDLARLAGCSYDYAKKYVEFLEWREIVITEWTEGRRCYFRLLPGKEQEGAPAWNRRAEKRRLAVSSKQ
jgi:hypothetical protein